MGSTRRENGLQAKPATGYTDTDWVIFVTQKPQQIISSRSVKELIVLRNQAIIRFSYHIISDNTRCGLCPQAVAPDAYASYSCLRPSDRFQVNEPCYKR